MVSLDRERLLQTYAPRLAARVQTQGAVDYLASLGYDPDQAAAALDRLTAARDAVNAVIPDLPRTGTSAGDAVSLLTDMVQQINDRDEQDEQEEKDDDQPTGVMVAFYPDPETAAALALSDADCEMARDMPGGTATTPKGIPMRSRPMLMPKAGVTMGEPVDPGDDPVGGHEDGPEEKDDQGGVDAEDADELHLTLVFLGTAGADVPESLLPTLLSTVKGWAATTPPITGYTSGIGVFANPGETVTYASVDCPALPAARQELVRLLTGEGLPVSATHGFTPHITLAYGDARDAEVSRLPLVFSTVSVVYAGQRTDFPMGPAPAVTGPPQVDDVAERARVVERVVERVDEWTIPTLTAAGASVTVPAEPWHAVVTDIGGRTFLTAPATTSTVGPELAAWAGAPNPNKHMLWMQGRFVGGDRPNKNGALWSSADLEMGKATVSHGPLNWLHEDRHVIGTIADAKFVPAPGGGGLQVAMDGMGGAPACQDPHIAALSVIWRWIYPDEASIVQMASDAQVLAYSMECISEAIQCVGDSGCQQTYSYLEYARGQACDHLQQRASVRRLVNPTFLGGAVIVPPTRPGWAEADATVLKQAAAMAEKAYEQAGRPDIPAATWDQMMAGVLTFAQGAQ
jgi:2'-5' RNA ligase